MEVLLKLMEVCIRVHSGSKATEGEVGCYYGLLWLRTR